MAQTDQTGYFVMRKGGGRDNCQEGKYETA